MSVLSSKTYYEDNQSKFQVETIGDAYCVACGLHRNTHIHAQQIAWMALKMIQACSHHLTHKGKPIRVRKYLRVLNVFYYWVCIPLKIDIFQLGNFFNKSYIN